MIVYHKKNSYFVPEADAKLIPMGSYVFKDDKVIYVNDLEDLAFSDDTVVEEPEVTPEESVEEEVTEPKVEE